MNYFIDLIKLHLLYDKDEEKNLIQTSNRSPVVSLKRFLSPEKRGSADGLVCLFIDFFLL